MFSVGDEVVCVDDGADEHGWVTPFPKGQKFVVLAVWPKATFCGQTYVQVDCISIGVPDQRLCDWARRVGTRIETSDIWEASRFRKIEKKRHRSELYALLGIDQMLTNKTLEPVDAR